MLSAPFSSVKGVILNWPRGGFLNWFVQLGVDIGLSDKKLIDDNLHLVSDLKVKYQHADTLQKREFLALGFTNNLYYQNGVYRTPTVLDIFEDK